MTNDRGENFEAGDRVYAFDFDGSIQHGTLMDNTEYPEVSKHYVLYDDGEECAVLSYDFLFKP